MGAHSRKTDVSFSVPEVTLYYARTPSPMVLIRIYVHIRQTAPSEFVDSRTRRVGGGGYVYAILIDRRFRSRGAAFRAANRARARLACGLAARRSAAVVVEVGNVRRPLLPTGIPSRRPFSFGLAPYAQQRCRPVRFSNAPSRYARYLKEKDK